MAGRNQPVTWMFAYKFNSASFPGCTDAGTVPAVGTRGIFGGVAQAYPQGHSQQYVFASSDNPTLVKGNECLGATLADPLGATFAQVFDNPDCYYVLWNDQFYGDPIPTQVDTWGHSKGMVAWNEDGEGLVLQVSTPSWPGSGSRAHPRRAGNTLGCIGDDDDIEVAQHFFALRLDQADLAAVLQALGNASVCTASAREPQPQIVRNGGPPDIQALVNRLGVLSGSTEATLVTLSTGVQLISKPSRLAVPPWQLVSAKLGGLDLRVASWWAAPAIYSTRAGAVPGCWAPGLGSPGAVEIALSGSWNGTMLGLKGDDGRQSNHAKLGVSLDPARPLCVFGDMNQMGAFSPGAGPDQACTIHQNGRGGMFFVLRDAGLFRSLSRMLAGDTAPKQAGPDGAGGTGASRPRKKRPATRKTASGSRPARKKKAAARARAAGRKKAARKTRPKPRRHK